MESSEWLPARLWSSSGARGGPGRIIPWSLARSVLIATIYSGDSAGVPRLPRSHGRRQAIMLALGLHLSDGLNQAHPAPLRHVLNDLESLNHRLNQTKRVLVVPVPLMSGDWLSTCLPSSGINDV
jgi:hypothetical protein